MDQRRWKIAGLIALAVAAAVGPFCFVWWMKTRHSAAMSSPDAQFEAELVRTETEARLVVTRKSDGAVVAMAPARVKPDEDTRIVWARDGGACGLWSERYSRWAAILRLTSETIGLSDSEVIMKLNEARQ